MKSIRMFAAAMLAALLMVSCSSSPKKLQVEIKTLEDSLFADATKMIDREMAQDLIDKYIEFADAFPNDPEAPATLFKAGDMAMNLNMPQKAIDIFDRIMTNYPDYEKTPQCLFLKGYVYENDFRDLPRAKEIYEEFLQKYPDDEFADDAAISIQNLGKSPEELIREFEERNKEEESSEI
jgi:outer membrane protein assembly factor BamD (BamD/ComL family)